MQHEDGGKDVNFANLLAIGRKQDGGAEKQRGAENAFPQRLKLARFALARPLGGAHERQALFDQSISDRARDGPLQRHRRKHRSERLTEKLRRNESGHPRVFDDEPKVCGRQQVIERHRRFAGLPNTEHRRNVFLGIQKKNAHRVALHSLLQNGSDAVGLIRQLCKRPSVGFFNQRDAG